MKRTGALGAFFAPLFLAAFGPAIAGETADAAAAKADPAALVAENVRLEAENKRLEGEWIEKANANKKLRREAANWEKTVQQQEAILAELRRRIKEGEA